MANSLREKARKFKAVLTRLFTGCHSASHVDVVDMPRQEEAITTAASVPVQDGEQELNVNQRAQLIVQEMIQQGVSYADYDTFMVRYQGRPARTEVEVSQHALESLLSTGPAARKANPMPPHGDLAAPIHTGPTAPVPPRGDVVDTAHTKIAAGTGPRNSFSVPNAPWSSYMIDGVAIPPHIQAVFARLTEMEANMGRILGGDVAQPHRKELPVFELPINPTFPPPLSLGSLQAPFNDILAPVRTVPNVVEEAPQNFKDVDSFMDKFIASMTPGSSCAKAKPALARAKLALCISDLDKSMDRLYSKMTGPVRTSLPALKLPVALGTVPTARCGPAMLKPVPTGALAVPTVPATLNKCDTTSILPRRRDIPVFQPGGALPAPHTVEPSDLATSVAIPRRWDIPVFQPAGASSDPRLMMPPGTSLIPPAGASSDPVRELRVSLA